MIQIDMEFPKCCDECFALDDHGDYPFCLISQDQRGYTFNVRENRMPSCPLKAQEPRVMTLEEVIEAVKQEEPMYICEAKFPGSARWIIPINADHWGFEERGSHCQFHYYDYLSKQIGGFCCWTSRPDEQRRAETPWE